MDVGGASSSSAPATHLVESVLWKEDVFVLGHRAVWGSWYDAEAKRWGYACCKSVRKDEPCTVAPPPPTDVPPAFAAAGKVTAPDSDSGIEMTSPDSEEQREEKPWDFANPPPELLPVEKFPEPAAYLEHFVRYLVGAWAREQEKGFVGFGEIQRTAFNNTLKDTQKAIAPLLWRLKKGESLERGEKKDDRRSRETRTSMEGKFVKEKSVLGQLMEMATKAADQEYIAAHAAYMHLTFGNKMWNLTHVAHVAACTMKGAREYRRNRDSLNTYDMDPVSQKYMHAMKKLIHFAQCIRPNEDASKNVVM